MTALLDLGRCRADCVFCTVEQSDSRSASGKISDDRATDPRCRPDDDYTPTLKVQE